MEAYSYSFLPTFARCHFYRITILPILMNFFKFPFLARYTNSVVQIFTLVGLVGQKVTSVWYSVRTNLTKLKWRITDNTGLQRNWGKHKNTRFYLICECWIQIWNPFLLITSSFLDMHSVHFVHIRYIKAYMNSGLILILWDLWLIF